MGRDEVVEAIIAECQRQEIDMPEQIAYVLATVEWETGKTFKPVREAYWLDEDYRRDNFRYYPYYGRGYVQLTWEENYRREGERLGLDLVQFPDLALDHHTALDILVYGFKHGTFTGGRHKISNYIREMANGKPREVDFFGARRCINGTDKASTIARMAEVWLVQLRARFPIGEEVGPLVVYTTTQSQPQAIGLQEYLNRNGLDAGVADGIAGPRTSAAFKGMFGMYLLGDPRAAA